MKDEMLALLLADLHEDHTAWIKFNCLHFSQPISVVLCDKILSIFVILSFINAGMC